MYQACVGKKIFSFILQSMLFIFILIIFAYHFDKGKESIKHLFIVYDHDMDEYMVWWGGYTWGGGGDRPPNSIGIFLVPEMYKNPMF